MNKLGEVFKISKGKKAIESSVETSLRYIQIGDLRNDDVMKYTTQSSNNVVCTKDDILIAWDGANAGTVGYNLEGVIGSTLAKLSPKRNGVHVAFVGRFLQSKFTYLRENCTGATIPHLSRTVLENLQIPLPPLEQQNKIAAIFRCGRCLQAKNQSTHCQV
jgi:type I restriction enzyme S subunit